MDWIMKPMAGFATLELLSDNQCQGGATLRSCTCTGGLLICDCSGGLKQQAGLEEAN